MKFASKEDIVQFLMDVGKIDAKTIKAASKEDWIPEEGMVHTFIKRRANLRRSYKDARHKSGAKSSWRQNRWKYMRGIHSFHKSVKGRKFHRNLGNFLARRIMRTGESFIEPEHLVAVSSLKTHLYLELAEFMPIHRELEFFEFLDSVLPVIEELEKNLLSSYQDGISISEMELSEEIEDMLFSVVDPTAISEELAKQLGKKVEDLQATWDKAEKLAKSEKAEADWRDVAKIFKGMVK